jgi:preprotein translocase subunit SecE
MADNDNEMNGSETTSEETKAPKGTTPKEFRKEKKKGATIWSKIAKFFRDFRSEMKKVVWLSKKQLKTNTILVIIAICVAAVAIGIFDYLCSTGLDLLGRLV